MTFTYGEPVASPPVKEDGSKTVAANPFLQESTPVPVGIDVFEQKVSFRQSDRSREFANPEEDEEALQTSYIQQGNVLHKVFATIRTADDVEKALLQMELDGVIYDQRLTREKIEDMIRKRLASAKVADWFSSRWKLFNECTILSVDPATQKLSDRRPDRVMTDGQETVVVDFKFGRERSEHHEQVREYMQLLNAMKFPGVSGFLWYVYSNKIVEVK